MSPLAEYLRSLRRRKNLSYAKLSLRTNFSESFLEKIENNPEKISLMLLKVFLDALRLTDEERRDFCIISLFRVKQRLLGQSEDVLPLHKPLTEIPKGKVLPFVNKNGIGFVNRKKSKKTQKDVE